MRSWCLLRGGRSSCHVPSRVLLCWRLCGSYSLPSGHLWQCDWPVERRVLGAVPVLCSRRDRCCIVLCFAIQHGDSNSVTWSLADYDAIHVGHGV